MKVHLLGLSALFGLASIASATWSICVIDMATGEVAVGTATCLENDDLALFVPMILVGKGAGAEQSAVDPSGTNRILMRDLLAMDSPPSVVLSTLLSQGTGPASKQYGIAGFAGFPATYSGSGAGSAVGNVVGQSGTLYYAIQGNVLTGPEVCFAAEEALLTTQGDLGQRMIAAMEAARSLGGDGRCSCAASDPTGCGAPPASFTKSAHVGLIFLARIGDTDGDCNGVVGCADGDYYLKLSVIDDSQGLDPVLQLRTQYDAWRTGLSGRPDALLSGVTLGAEALPADGLTQTQVTLDLVDIDGVPLVQGGADVRVSLGANGPQDLGLSTVVDRGDGSYDLTVTSGVTTGTAELVIVVDDGVRPLTLYPYPTLRLDAIASLHAGFDTVSASGAIDIPFVFQEASAASGLQLLLASLSGTSPGTPLGGVLLPLNRDAAFDWTLVNANGPNLPGSLGTVDASGRAEAHFVAPPGLLLPLVGLHIDWASLWISPTTLGATIAVGTDVLP